MNSLRLFWTTTSTLTHKAPRKVFGKSKKSHNQVPWKKMVYQVAQVKAMSQFSTIKSIILLIKYSLLWLNWFLPSPFSSVKYLVVFCSTWQNEMGRKISTVFYIWQASYRTSIIAKNLYIQCVTYFHWSIRQNTKTPKKTFQIGDRNLSLNKLSVVFDWLSPIQSLIKISKIIPDSKTFQFFFDEFFVMKWFQNIQNQQNQVTSSCHW